MLLAQHMDSHNVPTPLTAMVFERSTDVETANDQLYLRAQVELRSNLTTAIKDAIAQEITDIKRRNKAPKRRGEILPLSVSWEQQTLNFLFPKHELECLRLDVLLESLQKAGSPLGPILAPRIIEGLALYLTQLHEEKTALGYVCPKSIFLKRSGELGILLGQQPILQHLIVGSEPRWLRHQKSAPELLSSHSISASSDSYALAALYYELLCGSSCFSPKSPATQPIEIPGLLPDPRPSLVDFLRVCLNPHPQKRPSNANYFLYALKNELRASQTPTPHPKLFSEIVREYGSTHLVQHLGSPEYTAKNKQNPSSQEQSSAWEAILDEPLESTADVLLEVTADLPRHRHSILEKKQNIPLPTPQKPPTLSNITKASTTPPRQKITPPIYKPIKKSSQLPNVLIVLLGFSMLVFVASILLQPQIQTEPKKQVISQEQINQVLEKKSNPQPRNNRSRITRSKPKSKNNQNKGWISIISNPSGAKVEVNGQFWGTTPLVRQEVLNRRIYNVSISKNNYRTFRIRKSISNNSLNVVANLQNEN